jgi:hypothetical protein
MIKGIVSFIVQWGDWGEVVNVEVKNVIKVSWILQVTT